MINEGSHEFTRVAPLGQRLKVYGGPFSEDDTVTLGGSKPIDPSQFGDANRIGRATRIVARQAAAPYWERLFIDSPSEMQLSFRARYVPGTGDSLVAIVFVNPYPQFISGGATAIRLENAGAQTPVKP